MTQTLRATTNRSVRDVRIRRAKAGSACHQIACRAAVVLLVLLVVPLSSTNGQESVVSRENSIKAAYLYNFAKYVEWPHDYIPLADTSGPVFVIGIVGANPFGDALATIAREKKIGEKPIVIRQIAKTTDEVPCHIIFFPANANRELAEAVIAKAKNRPILLVGEHEDFIKSGGAINFFVEENKIRFEVSKSAAAAAKFKISSKLLSIGREAR